MAQVSDVTLDNQGFASFRTELNNILGALNTMHVGSSAPASVAAGTVWVDNGTSGVLKLKLNDGTDNVELLQVNISTNAVSSGMSVTGTVTDDAAITFTIASDSVNVIQHLVSQQSLFIFTSDGEFDMSGEPVTPSNVLVRKQTSYGIGSGVTTPKIVDNEVLFVAKGGKQLRAFVYNFNTDAFSANDLALGAELESEYENCEYEIPSSWKSEVEKYMTDKLLNGPLFVTDYPKEIKVKDYFKIHNYLSETGLFKITKAKKFVGEVKSEQRFYPVEKTKTTEAGIFNFILSDIYITMGEGNLKEGWVVKAYFNPLVKCLWFGAFIMAIGGILSLFSKTNRKYI